MVLLSVEYLMKNISSWLCLDTACWEEIRIVGKIYVHKRDLDSLLEAVSGTTVFLLKILQN